MRLSVSGLRVAERTRLPEHGERERRRRVAEPVAAAAVRRPQLGQARSDAGAGRPAA